ncbi:beta-lactamase/transpeptidase-like protein [Bisporella sp. PMI_857]|nr:beta-lactamase/transpeptidase-like protein [Bisporella sp. PMI_857]
MGQTPLASVPSTPFTPDFSALVNSVLEDWKVAGIAVAVVDGDSNFFRRYGFTKLPDVPVEPETVFYCASTTKAFTAAASSLLVDDERHPQVQWNTPINQLIPEDFVLEDDYWTQHIMIQDALTHRTGLPGHFLAYYGKNSTPKDLVRVLRSLKLTREPRTRLQYCNLMYVVICHVIESDPLGKSSTLFHIEDVLKSGKPIATGYAWDPDEKAHVAASWNPISGDGAGGIFSNVLDYAKWIRSMIERNGPLSQAGYYAKLPTHSDILYSYGWVASFYQGERILWNSGGLDGFDSQVAYLPDRKWGIVLLSNTSLNGAYAIGKLQYHLIDELLKVPSSKRVDWDAFPQLPLSLPLLAYVGTYSHPSYLSVEVSLKARALYIDGSDRIWPLVIELEHVSGEGFLVRYRTKTSWPWAVTKIEFHIGADGTVDRMGGLFEESMAPELAWFERVKM